MSISNNILKQVHAFILFGTKEDGTYKSYITQCLKKISNIAEPYCLLSGENVRG